ncbi:hypothetical protein KXW36_001107, partial [Aspergillus fumigatus]
LAAIIAARSSAAGKIDAGGKGGEVKSAKAGPPTAVNGRGGIAHQHDFDRVEMGGGVLRLRGQRGQQGADQRRVESRKAQIAEPRLAAACRVKAGLERQKSSAHIVVIARHFHPPVKTVPCPAPIAAGVQRDDMAPI